MELTKLITLGALGLGGYVAISGNLGTGKKNQKPQKSNFPSIRFPDFSNLPLGKGKSPAFNISTGAGGISGQLESLRNDIAKSFGNITGSVSKGIDFDPTGDIKETVDEAINDIENTTKDVVSIPRKVVEKESKEVASDVETAGNKAMDIGARGLPLATVGGLAGGGVGAGAGFVGGNLLYGIGERIGKATENIGNKIIEATGGTESPIFKAGKMSARVFNNQQFQDIKKREKQIEDRTNNVTSSGSNLNKTTSKDKPATKDKKGKKSMRERKLDVSTEEHKKLKEKMFERWGS